MSGNIIKAAITGDYEGLKGAVKGATSELDHLSSSAKSNSEKLTSAANKVTAGVAAGAAAIVAISLKNGDALNEAQDQLANTSEKAKLSVSGVESSVKSATPHFEAYGVTQTELTESVAGFIRIGDSQTKALQDAQHAADLAAVAHIDYASASKQVILADEGKFRGIAKYLGPLKNASDLTKAFTKIQGDAAIKSKSLGGEEATLKARFTDVTAHLGQKLIPLITSLFGWVSRNTGAVTALVIVIGTFVAAMVAVSIVSKVISLIQSLQAAWAVLNAVILANPLVAFIATIVLLVAAVVVAYQKVAWFRAGVQAAFKAIQFTVAAVVSFIQQHWQLLLAALTGGLSVAVVFVVQHFGTIRNTASSIISAVKGFFEGIPLTVVGVITRIVVFWATLPIRIAKAVGNGASVLVGFGSDLVHGIAQGIRNAAGDILNAFKSIIDHIPGHGLISKGLSAIGLGGWADGGMVPGPKGSPVLGFVHGGEMILNPRQQANAFGAGGGQIINNFPSGVTPSAVLHAQRKYARIQGGTR